MRRISGSARTLAWANAIAQLVEFGVYALSRERSGDGVGGRVHPELGFQAREPLPDAVG
jgi:hypothetical protein